MKTGIVVFARLDSTRLPGKALKTFAGRALLGHVIDRVAGAKLADVITVATSDRDVDDGVAALAQSANVAVYRGSVDNVLARAIACAEAFDLDHLVRICGDSPFMDPRLIDRIINIHHKHGADVTTNQHPRTYPAGLSVEVLTVNSLRRVAEMTDDSVHREHVTSFIYGHPEDFTIHNVDSTLSELDETPLTIDHADDLVQANWIGRRLHEDGRDLGDMDAVLALAREWRQTMPVGKQAVP